MALSVLKSTPSSPLVIVKDLSSPLKMVMYLRTRRGVWCVLRRGVGED